MRLIEKRFPMVEIHRRHKKLNWISLKALNTDASNGGLLFLFEIKKTWLIKRFSNLEKKTNVAILNVNLFALGMQIPLLGMYKPLSVKEHLRPGLGSKWIDHVAGNLSPVEYLTENIQHFQNKKNMYNYPIMRPKHPQNEFK